MSMHYARRSALHVGSGRSQSTQLWFCPIISMRSSRCRLATRTSLGGGGESKVTSARPWLPVAPASSATPTGSWRFGRDDFWEHTIRGDCDFQRHVDYIHYNPVKHGLVPHVRDWPHSSFHQYVRRGILPDDWAGDVRDGGGSYGERSE